MKHIFLFLSIILLLGSCATKKQIHYFQDAEDLNQSDINIQFEPIIEANDILHISISSIDNDVVKPFQRTTDVENNVNSNNPGLQGYLVNSSGMIRFPVLGDVKVIGKTRAEIEKDLKARLSEYVTDVVVDVRIMNFKVTVLGEVNNPGVYSVKDERVTLPEAIGLDTEKQKQMNITRKQRLADRVKRNTSVTPPPEEGFINQNQMGE